MKAVKALAVVMLAVFSYTSVSAQIHHMRRHYHRHVVHHHVIVHHR